MSESFTKSLNLRLILLFSSFVLIFIASEV